MTFQNNLEKQLLMNKTTWERLLANGVKSGQAVDVDFFIECPSEKKALLLSEYLNKRIASDVAITPSGLFKKKWKVTGHINQMRLSLDKLDQWVESMVQLADEYGADFDGWGVQL